MATDGKILAQAKNLLAGMRAEKELQLERRSAEVYAACPQIEDIDLQIRSVIPELISIVFETGDAAQVGQIREKHGRLLGERRKLLAEAGYSEDYLDDGYMCPLCKDTGYTGSVMCRCLKQLYKAQKQKDLSRLLKLGNETFGNFNLSYYDDKPMPSSGVSPRRLMEIVFETCEGYARNFNDNSMNLFLNGAPGLGKTYLSACIARVVSEKDYSVVYDTAGSVFSMFEDVKFSKAEDMSRTREDIRRCLECDLLILDDLGTEMTTAQTIEALYELVNTRLITNKKTIINSNLTIDEMNRRYSEQIMSRLEGEYQILTFYGDDIRKKRKDK